MKTKKILLAALSIVLLAGSAAASHSGTVEVQPLNQTAIDTNSSINDSNISQNTFPFDLETGSDSITANISLDFPPQNYTGEVVLENNHSHSYTVDLQRSVDWRLNRDEINETVNVGTSGRFTNQSIILRGNTDTEISTKISGNISQYLDATEQTTVFPGVDSRIVLSYQVPRTSEYGNYTGVLNLTGEYGSYEEVPLNFQFKDNITPEIESVETPSFDAGFPSEFSVEASDNIGVETVNAEILETVVNNRTEENRSVQDLEFSHQNNTDQWTATPPGEENGTYYLKGTVIDEAGNKANFSTKYTVRPLNAVDMTSGSIDLNNYRVETEISEKFGEINRSTRMNVELESFSQPMQSPNETWTLAILTDSGKQFLREEGSTVTVNGPTDLDLFVYSNVAERFNGKLSFDPEGEHVPVENKTFSGSYLDCPVPEEKTESVFNKTIRFTPTNSDNCGDASLNVSYQILMKNVDSMDEIGDSMGLYFPREVEQDIDQTWKQRLEDKQEQLEKARQNASSEDFWGDVAKALLGLTVLALVWEKREADSWYYVHLKDTKSVRERMSLSDDEEGGVL
jgi:opacity protein-like surface antigen